MSSSKPMTPFAANPFIFIFSALALAAVLMYFGRGALDRLGLSDEPASAVITGKHYYPPGVTYHTTIAAGRAWTMADSTSEHYVLELNVGQEPIGTVVSKEIHDALKVGDRVQVTVHRTRFTRRLEVTQVER
ncbi:MAG: hypothetical protein ABIW85_07260 [Variovorax sp.]